MTIKVVVAEDHKLVSQGIVAMLGMDNDLEVIAAVGTGEQAVETVRNEDVDIVLMDVNLGKGLSGLQATKKIKEFKPHVKVLILTMFTDSQTVSDALRAGADGYLSKGATREIVLKGIREIVEGRPVLDPNIHEGLFGHLYDAESERQLERENPDA